jgi:hypothetical protein
MAYHVWMNPPPPIATWTVLGVNVSPAVSLTVNAAPSGQQLQPTTITSEDYVVVSDTEQVVMYPHPFWVLPSSAIGEAVAEACAPEKPKIDRAASNAAIEIDVRISTKAAVRRHSLGLGTQEAESRHKTQDKVFRAESGHKKQNPT